MAHGTDAQHSRLPQPSPFGAQIRLARPASRPPCAVSGTRGDRHWTVVSSQRAGGSAGGGGKRPGPSRVAAQRTPPHPASARACAAHRKSRRMALASPRPRSPAGPHFGRGFACVAARGTRVLSGRRRSRAGRGGWGGGRDGPTPPPSRRKRAFILLDESELSFFSTTTVFGTPLDVTLSEVAIEAAFRPTPRRGRPSSATAATDPGNAASGRSRTPIVRW